MKLSDCTPPQIHQIAAAMASAGSRVTYNSLRHVVRGRRGVSAAVALQIEHAARSLGLDIRREDLADACAGCEFAAKCRAKVKPPAAPKPAKPTKPAHITIVAR